MNTHPEKWYIPVTKENHKELNRWRLSKRTREASKWDHQFVPGSILASEHPCDGSYFFLDHGMFLRSYREITLEEFRKITNTEKTPKNMQNPDNWYILVTDENQAELQPWWQEQVRKSGWGTSVLHKNRLLLSKHPEDSSYYWSGNLKHFTELYPHYQEITLEQFRQITKPTMSKQIQISRELLNEYYEASTIAQREYLTEHFKLDGSTTVEAIRGLHDMACKDWKPKIKANHPDCFPEENKYFDFSSHSRYEDKFIVSPDVCKSLGLENDFIQVRNSLNLEVNQRSFYLSSTYNWKLLQDGDVMVLMPTKKSSTTTI